MSLAPHEAAVRKSDHERFLCALFAPKEVRRHLLALLAFNLEIAKTREVVSEPMIGQIRLQWWRDAVEEIFAGKPRAHDVIQALAQGVAATGMPKQQIDAMIDGREADLDDNAFNTLDELEDYAIATSGGLSGLWAGASISGFDPDNDAVLAARHIGTAWSLVGQIRALPFHASQGRRVLPDALMGPRESAARRAYAQHRDAPELSSVVAVVCDRAARLLQDARARRSSIPPVARSACLLATLADRHLRALKVSGYRVFRPDPGPNPLTQQLRLLTANMSGRW